MQAYVAKRAPKIKRALASSFSSIRGGENRARERGWVTQEKL